MVLVDPCQDALDQLSAGFPREADLHVAVVDGRDMHGLQGVVKNLPAQFRHVDSLVNAASLRHWPESSGAHLADDLIGMLNLTEALIPTLKALGSKSSIVNIGLKSTHEQSLFVEPVCKLFLHNLRRGLIGSGVRVEDVALNVDGSHSCHLPEHELARRVLTIAQSTPPTHR